ncbi:MAG: MerR family transcriptional regulator [Oscillospiraceae bacterium]|nr:MerR family transcriptional regulator [Oscillospiraceae bacterium]
MKTGDLSNLTGLTAQTIRKYEDMGLLEAEKDQKSNYRHFRVDSVGKTIAIRYLRNMGCTLDEVARVLSPMTQEEYVAFFDCLMQRQLQKLKYETLVCQAIEEQTRLFHSLMEDLHRCTLLTDQGFFFFDYMRNGQELPLSDQEKRQLHDWTEQAMFTKNASPFYHDRLYPGPEREPVMGLAVQEYYAREIGLDVSAPVYRRSFPLCIYTRIHHDIDDTLKTGALEHVFRYLDSEGLSVCSQPFIFGDCTYYKKENQPEHYSRLYIPVERRKKA